MQIHKIHRQASIGRNNLSSQQLKESVIEGQVSLRVNSEDSRTREFGCI